MLLFPLRLTFAGGVDVDDLFASVDERLLNLIEFSAKRIIEVMLTKKTFGKLTVRASSE